MSGPLAGAAKAAGEMSIEAIYRHLPSAVTKFNDIIAAKGQGSWVWDTKGNKYLDLTSGIGTTSTGHCHPKVVAAVQDQATKIVHAQQNIFGAHTAMAALLERLPSIMPDHLPSYFFCSSGSEAVDNAVKIARAVTGRQNIIAFDGGFHGRTLGAMALTTSKVVYRQNFGPLIPGVFIAPYPYCLYCKWQEAQGFSGYHVAPYCQPFDEPSKRVCCNAPLEALEQMLIQTTAPSETAAIILEPILGEGGFLTPPPGFMGALRRICDKHGILLIADEVQSGAGRTGTWWGHQQFEESKPDLMIFAKGIASGYPFAGVAARDGFFDKLVPGTMGGTYGGNAVSCAAAAATIDAIVEDGMLDNAKARGQQLMQGLARLSSSYPITDIRGRGLMVGLEFGGKDGSRNAEKGVVGKVMKAAFKRNLLTMGAGARESMRILPPLNVSKEEIEHGLEGFEGALKDVFG